MEILLDDLNVRALVGRICSLGWVTPAQFETLWDVLMSILTRVIADVQVRVLCITVGRAVYTCLRKLLFDCVFLTIQESGCAEFDRRRSWAIRGISSLCASLLINPAPGCTLAQPLHVPRAKDIPFLHSKYDFPAIFC
jgi:hypothetical protein